MTGIDRRSLVGALGAGLMLAASGESNAKGRNGTKAALRDSPDTYFDLESFKSDYVAYGTFPQNQCNIGNVVGQQKPEHYRGTFDPQHICIVYLNLGTYGGAKILHAHFSKPLDNEEAFVARQLDRIKAGQSWDSPIAGSDGENFDNWGFGSQSLIYMGLDDYERIHSFDSDNLLQFAFYSARRVGGKKVPKHQNNSFMNCIIDEGIWPGYQILIFENWYVDENGKDIPPRGAITEGDKRHYSMNIHLRTKVSSNTYAGGVRDIPTVIDPDPGNMGSNP